MKKLLPILCILLSHFLINAQNSNYHSFPDSNAVWNYNYWMYCFQNGTADENYSIVLNGDTFINGITYSKLFTPYIEKLTNDSACGDMIPIGYRGAIRDDVLNRKVYFVPPNDTTEQLLYDFTLSVGDTVKGYTQHLGIDNDVVQSIDSVLIGNKYHKRLNIDSCYNHSFIEGVGSTYGLIEYSASCIMDLPSITLTCFQNGLKVFPSSSSACNIITSINKNERKSYTVKIYPNPSNDFIKIDFNGAIKSGEILIEIINIEGKKVLSKELKNPQETLQIPISDLSNGVYFYSIKDKTASVASGKIIIER